MRGRKRSRYSTMSGSSGITLFWVARPEVLRRACKQPGIWLSRPSEYLRACHPTLAASRVLIPYRIIYARRRDGLEPVELADGGGEVPGRGLVGHDDQRNRDTLVPLDRFMLD